jgi:hypothetical protein
MRTALTAIEPIVELTTGPTYADEVLGVSWSPHDVFGITLGATVHVPMSDGGAETRTLAVADLRMPVAVARRLHEEIGKALGQEARR